MKISYIREMKRNYLMAETEGGRTAEYEARMLCANPIQGLLNMKVKYKDGQAVYCYDITSRQPLDRLLETRPITRDEIRSFLIQMQEILNQMDSYLLGDGGLLLEPQYMYIEPELFQLGLCFLPGRNGNFPEAMSSFLQYLLKQVDHRNRESVVLAYGLYQESLKENYGMDNLMSLLAEEDGRLQRDTFSEEKRKEERTTDRIDSEECKNGVRIQDRGEKRKWEEERVRGGETGYAAEINGSEERRWGDTENSGDCEEWYIRRSGNEKQLGRLRKQIGAWLMSAVFVPGAVWLLRGEDFLFQWKYYLAAGEGLLLGIVILINLIPAAGKKLFSGKEKKIFGKGGGKAGDKTEHRTGNRAENKTEDFFSPEMKDIPHWQEDSTLSHSLRKTVSQQNAFQASGFQESAFQASSFQTALLNDGSRSEFHRLVSIKPELEDIAVLYYPFVIGKHQGLADYILDRDTVSRFHLRIDKEGERITVTDLNSTNGTQVGGKLLDANETAEIRPGDEIWIADAGYIWR